MNLFRRNYTNQPCPTPTSFETYAPEPFIGHMSFYQLNMIISGTCTALSCLVSFALMAVHASHLSKPSEQIKIMRICSVIPIYTLISFLSVCYPIAHTYLHPWQGFYQAITVGGFFLLLCEFVAPGDSRRDLFYATLRVPRKRGQFMSGTKWFRQKWIAIFQYPIIALLIGIITDITQAANVYCLGSSKPQFANIWLSVIGDISVTMAVFNVFDFCRVLKTQLAGHQPLAKFAAFKLVVGLTFLEDIIFLILRSTHTLNPGPTLTYADANFGIQSMIICIQMVPLSIFFPFAYRVQPYLLSKREPTIENANYQGGPLGFRAWLVFLNPMEIFSAVKFAFTMATSKLRTRDNELDVLDSTQGPSRDT